MHWHSANASKGSQKQTLLDSPQPLEEHQGCFARWGQAMRAFHCIIRIAALLAAAVWLVAADNAWAEEPKALVVEAAIPRGGYAMVYGFDSLWMMSDSRLARVNSADNSIIDIDLPAGENGTGLSDAEKYRGIAIGEGGVWIPDVGNSVIYKVDPQSNEVVLTVPTFIVGSAGNIGVGAGAVWVITFEDHDKTLTRYDPDTGEQVAQIALPRPCKAVVVDFGRVWVSAASSPELYVIDPQTNLLQETIPIHAPSHLLTSGAGSIWIGYDTEGIVEGIDSDLRKVTTTVNTGVTDMESDGDIAVGGGYIWMINRGSTLMQIDPETGSLKAVLRPPVGTLLGRRVKFGDDALWVSGASVFRIKLPSS
jgi:hypothetical protein